MAIAIWDGWFEMQADHWLIDKGQIGPNPK